jgi:hypothetical protein
VLKHRRLLSSMIVLAALGVIAWFIAGSEFPTPISLGGAQQSGRAVEGVSKGEERPASPTRSSIGGASGDSVTALGAAGGDSATGDDINAKLGAITKKLDELSLIEKKLNSLAAAVARIQEVPRGQRDTPIQSGQPRVEFWVLAVLGIATLSLLFVLALRDPLRQRGMNRAETERINPVEFLLPRFQDQSRRTEEVVQKLGQLHAAVQGLAAELRKFQASIANEIPHARLREVPAEPASVPRKPLSVLKDAPPPKDISVSPLNQADDGGSPSKVSPVSAPRVQLDALAGNILRDFHQMATDDTKTREFLNRWHPQSVIMANFEQRVRESGFSPELVVRNSPIGSNDEHFWFVQLASSHVGYILPARRLLMHRSALRGEGAAKLFRLIFEIVPSESFSVERPAYAELEGERVRIIQAGAIALQY